MTLLKMSSVTRTKIFSGLQQLLFTELHHTFVVPPTPRKSSSLMLHVEQLRNGVLFSQGRYCFFISLICSSCFQGLHKPLCQCLSLMLNDYVSQSHHLRSMNQQNSYQKSYCNYTLASPYHHSGSTYRWQYRYLRKAVTPEQPSAAFKMVRKQAKQIIPSASKPKL